MKLLNRHMASLLILVFSLLFMGWVNHAAVSARALPAKSGEILDVYRADSQKEIYYLYKAKGLHGARIVHLNRFLNMVDYLPREENVTMPFPVTVHDSRAYYEKGIDHHNWLFIANRTGMARTVSAVMPDRLFNERRKDFAGNVAYKVAGEFIEGYTHDIPVTISTLAALPVFREPVIVNLDAGYFGWDEDPARVARLLRVKCPDIRLFVISDSFDEPEISDESRRRLAAFLNAWGAGS